MKGFLLTIVIEDKLFMLEFFKFFRIGFARNDELIGKTSILILGIWKLETNIAFILRRKLEWHDFGKKAGQA
jgi:hypothetical protein